eukprot:2984116-Karenia_brevis.AAC.1
MPDTYMRRAMTLALKLQEDCLTMIQKSGSLPTDPAPPTITNENADESDDAPDGDLAEVASTPTCTPSSTDTESSEPTLPVIDRDTSKLRSRKSQLRLCDDFKGASFVPFVVINR